MTHSYYFPKTCPPGPDYALIARLERETKAWLKARIGEPEFVDPAVQAEHEAAWMEAHRLGLGDCTEASKLLCTGHATVAAIREIGSRYTGPRRSNAVRRTP